MAEFGNSLAGMMEAAPACSRRSGLCGDRNSFKPNKHMILHSACDHPEYVCMMHSCLLPASQGDIGNLVQDWFSQLASPLMLRQCCVPWSSYLGSCGSGRVKLQLQGSKSDGVTRGRACTAGHQQVLSPSSISRCCTRLRHRPSFT